MPTLRDPQRAAGLVEDGQGALTYGTVYFVLEFQHGCNWPNGAGMSHFSSLPLVPRPPAHSLAPAIVTGTGGRLER